MKIKKLAIVSVWGEDVPALINFYGYTLGLPLLPHHGARPHFKAGETAITILEGNQAAEMQATPFPLLAFEVEDLDLVVEELERQKIEFPWALSRMRPAAG